MKTLYFKTNQYVRRQGNVIDLNEYRARMASTARPAVGDDVTYHWETDESVWHYEERSRKKAPAKSRKAPNRSASHKQEKRSARKLADQLELCAAVALLGLVLTIWLQFLFL